MSKKRLWISLAVVALVVSGAALGFGPLVRSRAQRAADRVGAKVEIDWVVPGWAGVRLEGVHVTHPDAPSLRADFDKVFVSWTSPRIVELGGGAIHAEGSVDEILAQVERVRERVPKSQEEPTGSGGGTTVSIEGLAADYKGPTFSAEARGIKISRDGKRVALDVEAGKLDHTLGSAAVATLHLELDRSGKSPLVERLTTGALELSLALPESSSSSAASAEPAGGTRAAKLARARAELVRGSKLFEELVSPTGVVELSGVRAELKRGDERLGIGPATLRFVRKDGRLRVEYVAGGESGAEQLMIRSDLPGEGEPLLVEMHGGPLALSTLGVKEGDFHLVDTDRTTFRADAKFEVDAHAEVFSFDGETTIKGLSAKLPQISREPLRGVSASFRGSVRAALDGTKLTVKGGELEVGNVRLATNFDATLAPAEKAGDPPKLKLDGSYEVPLVPCQSLLDAAPQGLLPNVSGMHLAGSFALKGIAKFDTDKLDKTYDVRWDISSSCRVVDVPKALEVAQFRSTFKHPVYDAQGERTTEFETGPGSANWTSFNNISRFMPIGVVSFEDARFPHHSGFDQEAIKNSIRENLRKWQFVRGASTISMQLAKNLYLSRDKLLSRKLEELFLTMYLEQALTKDQMLELYLNIVEFGPNVYGIDAAAAHYFHTSPAALTLSQAFYIASILPSPKKEHFGAGGALSDGWLKLLRTVMKHSNKRNRISDDDLAAGLAEIPVRGSPTPLKDPNAESVARDDEPVATPDAP